MKLNLLLCEVGVFAPSLLRVIQISSEKWLLKFLIIPAEILFCWKRGFRKMNSLSLYIPREDVFCIP